MPRGQRARLDSDMVRKDRPVYMSGGAFSLSFSLVLSARLAPFHRLPFTTVHRESLSALSLCGEGELVDGVHTLVWRSVQVYHELQVLEEEDKGREEVQEIGKEST